MMKHRIHLVAAAIALAMLSGCATTQLTTTAMADSDKAIIAAQDLYALAAKGASIIAADPSTSAATRAAIGAANDKAAAALHTANQVRSSAAIALAVTAIADLQTLTGSK